MIGWLMYALAESEERAGALILKKIQEDAEKERLAVAAKQAQSNLEEYIKSIQERVPADGEKETSPNTSGGKKFDSGKIDYTLLPFGALDDVVRVLGFGATKYGRDNWQKVERHRYVAAAFRHLTEIAKGNTIDDESGKPHAAHLTCCSLFIAALDLEAAKPIGAVPWMLF